MSETLTVAIDATKGTTQPTLEEEAAKLDAAMKEGGEQTGNEDRPSWLNEKFAKPEDLAKAYEELEKKLGEKSGDEAKPEGEGEGEPEDDADKPVDQDEARKAADEITKKAGLDLNTLNQKYAETGAIDASDYEALAKIGIAKPMVDQFIAGQEALRTAQANTVFSTVGGEENYQAMVEWAGANLPAKEINAFNRAVNGTDMDVIMLAVKGLKAQYDGQVGFEPKTTVQGQTSTKAGSASYASIAEMQRDMANPKYQNDPAFRKMVEQKLARSDIF